MSYYYHNYLICSKQAKNKITSYYNDDYFDDLSGYYDDYIYKISSDNYLVIFDTRDHKYCTSFIEKFVSDFKDTTWYAIDEELGYQTHFYWDGVEASCVSRELYWSNEENEVMIEYSDDEGYRPLFMYSITDKRIVVEDILKNKFFELKLNEAQGRLINDYLKEATKKESVLDFNQYEIPYIDNIHFSVSIKFNGYRIYIDSLEKGEKRKVYKHENGNQISNGLIHTINNILIEKGINALALPLPNDKCIKAIIEGND